MKVTFLTRPGCHLCDRALAELNGFLAREVGSSFGEIQTEVVNIEADDDLHRLYLEKIPVILLEGERISELAFDPEEMDAALARQSQGSG